MSHPLADDLDHVLTGTAGLWDDLRGQRVFITGGTGFIGCWLLESLLWANDRLRLDVSVVVLTRDAAAFVRKAPHLAGHSAVRLHPGDVRSFVYPEGRFACVIHAATDSARPVEDAGLLYETIVDGTRRALECARAIGATRFLLTSSGAVYGRQPSDLPHLREEYDGGSSQTYAPSSYRDGKRAAEALCAAHADDRLQPTIARCFAFIGPYLPLDAHFAAGNFIRDALHGGPIRIAGDGTPGRSYLYASDLAIWLWTILLRGVPARPYNVGSAHAVTIAELARLVADTCRPAAAIEVGCQHEPGTPIDRYVPAVTRAAVELGLRPTVSLEEGIRKTLAWHTTCHDDGRPAPALSVRGS